MTFSIFRESLFRNSLYLMLSTAIMAGLGFCFWLINARLYSSADIGHATALLSSMTMLAILSLIGFDSVYVRFLPKETDRDAQVNTGLLLVGLTALFCSGVYMLFAELFLPEFSFVTGNPLLIILFIGATIICALNTLTDAIFISLRKNLYILSINTTFSAAKVLFPFAFISYGPLGIFLATIAAQTIGLILSLTALSALCGFRLRLRYDTSIIKRVWKYSSFSYFAGVLSLLPSSTVPLLVLKYLGPSEAAFFYIATMIAGLLYVIPSSTTSSLFAESSNEESSHSAHVKRTLEICALFLTPAVIILLVGSPLFLSIFGDEYKEGASSLLRLLALNSIAVTFYYTATAIFRFTKNLRALIITNAVYATLTIGLCYLLVPYGLVGIGIAYLTADGLAGLCGFILYKLDLRAQAIRLASY